MSLFGEPEFESIVEINRSLGLETVVPEVGALIPPGVGLGAGVGVVGPPPVTQTHVQPAGPLAAVPAALAAVGGAVPALAGIAGAGAALFGIAQGLGLGEGEGIFGLDVLGGDTQYLNGIPLGGPGLAEPPASMVLKEWHVSYSGFRLQYYLVQMPRGGRRIAMYNTRTKRWKSWPWRTPHLAVIGKNMPSHKQLTRLKRNMKRHRADAQTIMKLTGGMPGQDHHGKHRTYRKRHH